MTDYCSLPTENFNTVIHRSPGLGQDLDWLKSLHAEKILLVTQDHTTQRRLRLQTLTDARFVVLTEDQATAAQIQELQERVNTLEAEKAEAETRAEQAETKLQNLQQNQALATESERFETLEAENEKLRAQQQRWETEWVRAERQLDMLRDRLLNRGEYEFPQ